MISSVCDEKCVVVFSIKKNEEETALLKEYIVIRKEIMTVDFRRKQKQNLSNESMNEMIKT